MHEYQLNNVRLPMMNSNPCQLNQLPDPAIKRCTSIAYPQIPHTSPLPQPNEPISIQRKRRRFFIYIFFGRWQHLFLPLLSTERIVRIQLSHDKLYVLCDATFLE